jgi:UDP-N-acetylmuramoylalanine--D-glutamate ligase
VVVGFGVTGRAVARHLVSAGDRVLVLDDNPGPDAAATGRQIGVVVEVTPPAEGLGARIAGSDLVVVSPGVAVGHPIYTVAGDLAMPVISEIELAMDRLGLDGPKVVAITGTNGKTTVTTLVTAMLEYSGLAAAAAGNIGLPLIEAISSGQDVVVAEVSSFQLEFTRRFRPAVSCWLNLAADHLDWHPSAAHYAAAKSRIWANQGPGDTAVLNADDGAVMTAGSTVPAGVARIHFSIHGPADYALVGDDLTGPDGLHLLTTAELPRAFPHDIANALAAAAVALSAGATLTGCRQALRTTGPLPHRVSFVASADGVAWYDDSKATTPASVMAAAAGFDSVVLIAGGRNKGLDLKALRDVVPPVRAVVAIGEAAGEVAEAFAGRVPVSTAATMAEAVDAAGRLAESGDAVLLSPGCASFDWYTSYAARGDDFAALVTARLQAKRQPIDQGTEGEPRC